MVQLLAIVQRLLNIFFLFMIYLKHEYSRRDVSHSQQGVLHEGGTSNLNHETCDTEPHKISLG